MTAGTDHPIPEILNELELQRKTISKLKVKSYILIGVGILCVIGGFFLGSLLLIGLLPGLGLLIYGFIVLGKGTAKFKEYRHAYKQRVISSALKSIDNSLEIDYQNGMSEDSFLSSQLFNREPDRYAAQDMVMGTAGKTRFMFSEVHAEYKEQTRTKEGTKTEWYDIFKGIIFCADFNKNFKGITVVEPRDAGAALGAWISNNIPLFSSSSRPLVTLENPTFESKFVTHSTDQVEARYILTPAMMERLCELDDRSTYTITLSFINSYMFIAFPMDKDYFEPPVFSTLLDQKSLNEDIAIMRFMYSITTELDLNTRIWGKE